MVDTVVAAEGAIDYWGRFRESNLLPGISSISDAILKGGKSALKFEVITRQPEALSHQLMDQLHHGVTVLQAEGMYSETPRYLLICVVNRHQVVRFQEVLSRFPDTFAYVSGVNETLGNFKHIA